MECYISNEILNISSVRKLAGNQYLKNIQQDAGEFIIHLINNLNDIKIVTECQINVTLRCKNCNYMKIETHTNYKLLLHLPKKLKKLYTFEELMQYNFSHWINVEKLCTNCNAKSIFEKTDIIIKSNGILIFKLMLFEICNKKIANLNIKAIPTTKISVNANKYKIISAIFYHGENIID